jgi:hypothetical protein
VQLRYEEPAITAEAARQMTTVLDEEFARVSSELGCPAGERIVAVAQSPEAYRATTAAAEWSGGQFDGRIRVPVFDGSRVESALRRTLAHEMTHACLAMLGQWPAWLHEGIAQKLSGETVAPDVRQALAQMARQSALPKLSGLGRDWSRLDTTHARLAYGLSLMAIELLYQDQGAWGLRNLLRNPTRLGAVTADLDHRLGL